MQAQQVDLAIINRALGLHQHTPLASTLLILAELAQFRAQHQPCSSINFILRDQTAQIRATVLQQASQHLKQRIDLARQESERMFRVESIGRKQDGKSMRKVVPKYASVEEMVEGELDVKLNDNKMRGRGLKVSYSVSQYYLPPGESVRSERVKFQKEERGGRRRKEEEEGGGQRKGGANIGMMVDDVI